MTKEIDPLILSSLPFESVEGDFVALRSLPQYGDAWMQAALGLLKMLIKKKRYYHSLSVGSLCQQAALRQGYDPNKAKWAGVLHDCAKSLKEGKTRKLMAKYFPEYVSAEDWAYHQFLGGLLVKELFGIEDEEIIGAISFHATGKANMSWLGKLVYACDKIDPLRGYDSSDMIQSVLADIEGGFLYVLDENRKFYISKGYPIGGLTGETFRFYLESE